MRGFARRSAFLAQLPVDDGNATGYIEKLIHTGRGLSLLSAHTLQFTSLTECRLLTLVTKHVRHSNKFKF